MPPALRCHMPHLIDVMLCRLLVAQIIAAAWLEASRRRGRPVPPRAHARWGALVATLAEDILDEPELADVAAWAVWRAR